MDASRTLPLAEAQPPATPTPATPIPARRPRVWPALLALYFLAPFVGEVISGSTPPLLFAQPFGFLFTPLLYGSSAILIREIVVRRSLGWGNVLLLGAAFGIFQEALVVQTWFNFVAKDSPSHSVGMYGVLRGTSWAWALDLTIYHAAISIAIPLILIGLFFPHRAQLPWLGRKSAIALTLWLLIPCGLLAYGVAFVTFAKEGYAGPPLAGYLVAVALTAAAIALGVVVRFPTPRPDPARSAPGLWTVRLTGFALMTLFFALDIFLPGVGVPAPAAIILEAAVFAFGVWRVRSWSARVGWDGRHRLALVMGMLAYFVFLFGPLIEFVGRLPLRSGLTLMNLLIFGGFALFARRLARRTHPSTSPAELAGLYS